MATHEGVIKAFVLLRRAYPDHVNRHLSAPGAMTELVEFYDRFCQDIDDEVLIAAVAQHISQSQWWPKVAEIRASAFDLITRKLDMPSAFEAWANVKKNLGRADDRRQWLHPMVKKAIDSIGGIQAFGMSPTDQEAAWRARFVQSYEIMVKRDRARADMLPEVKVLADRLRLGSGERLRIEGGV